jgi:hypothetical protein
MINRPDDAEMRVGASWRPANARSLTAFPLLYCLWRSAPQCGQFRAKLLLRRRDLGHLPLERENGVVENLEADRGRRELRR